MFNIRIAVLFAFIVLFPVVKCYSYKVRTSINNRYSYNIKTSADNRCFNKATTLARTINECNNWGRCYTFIDNKEFNTIYYDCMITEYKWKFIEFLISISIIIITFLVCMKSI
jgi:hypothetical protein